MEKGSRFITSMVLLFVVTFLYAVVQQSSTAQRSDFSNLTLKIESTKELFVELEPIPITLNLRNESGQAVLAHSAFDLSNNFVKLFIHRRGRSTS